MRLRHVKNADEIICGGKYFVSDAKEYKGKWNNVFQNHHPIYLEIGMGKGNFIIENAIRYPNINFIGIEKFDSVLVRAIQKSDELELNNLRFIRMDAKDIGDVFEEEIDLIYLNFSDPWPKDRHAKRRLTSSVFLDKYKCIFKKDYHIIMKTDNVNLFEYSCDSLEDFGYVICKKSNDLYSDEELLHYNIPTEYEKRFVGNGIKIHYLDAVCKKK